MELVAEGLVNVIAWIAIVSGLLLAIWWLVGLYGVHTREQERRLPGIELPDRLHEKIAGIPPFLMIFFIFTGICLISYMLAAWLAGVSY